MGTLVGTNMQGVVHLPSRCLIGRSRACDLMLAARDVSSQHAVVNWTGSVWELQDLGSRNGTFIEEHRLTSGERAPWRRGLKVRFGRQSGLWELTDESPCGPMAVELASGRVRLAEAGLISLPDGDSPELLLYAETVDRWVAERHGETAEVGDRAVVIVGHAPWRVHLPSSGSGTWEDSEDSLTVDGLHLRFSHTPNEEYVELVATTATGPIDLHARAHHYPLLLLARARLADQTRQVPATEQGWIHQDRILSMLKIEPSHLNIIIHRSRLQLSQAGVTDAARLIERRKGTRQLRIGVARLEIVRL